MGSPVQVSPVVGEPSGTLPGCCPLPSPSATARGAASGSGQDGGEATWHVPSTLKRWRYSPNHPLPQLVPLFGDMGCVTGDETTLLAVRPARGSDAVGQRVQSPPTTPCPPSPEVPGSRLEAQANPPGCTCCVGSAGPIDAVDSCNQLECPGTRWDKHTLSITRWPEPAQCQRQLRGALPGTARLGLHQPREQRYPGLPFTEILPQIQPGTWEALQTPSIAPTTCPNLPGAGHRPTHATILYAKQYISTS